MPHADPDIRPQCARERARRRTAERIARGLCPRCGKQPPEPGRSLCQQCGERRRLADRARATKRRQAGIKRAREPDDRKAEHQRARQRAEDRLTRGLCARCGRDPHEPDRRLCAACGERQRRLDRERYAKARAANRPYGGRNPETKRAQARRRTRNRQHARRAASLCIRCGTGSPVESGSSCETCLTKRRTADRATYAARRAAGLCTRCAGRSFDGAPVCGPCTVLEDRYREAKESSRPQSLRRAPGAGALYALRGTPDIRGVAVRDVCTARLRSIGACAGPAGVFAELHCHRAGHR